MQAFLLLGCDQESLARHRHHRVSGLRFYMTFERVTIRGARPSQRLSEKVCSQSDRGVLTGLCVVLLQGFVGLTGCSAGISRDSFRVMALCECAPGGLLQRWIDHNDCSNGCAKSIDRCKNVTSLARECTPQLISSPSFCIICCRCALALRLVKGRSPLERSVLRPKQFPLDLRPYTQNETRRSRCHFPAFGDDLHGAAPCVFTLAAQNCESHDSQNRRPGIAGNSAARRKMSGIAAT